jgi:hypothetical protein
MASRLIKMIIPYVFCPKPCNNYVCDKKLFHCRERANDRTGQGINITLQQLENRGKGENLQEKTEGGLTHPPSYGKGKPFQLEILHHPQTWGSYE